MPTYGSSPKHLVAHLVQVLRRSTIGGVGCPLSTSRFLAKSECAIGHFDPSESSGKFFFCCDGRGGLAIRFSRNVLRAKFFDLTLSLSLLSLRLLILKQLQECSGSSSSSSSICSRGGGGGMACCSSMDQSGNQSASHQSINQSINQLNNVIINQSINLLN